MKKVFAGLVILLSAVLCLSGCEDNKIEDGLEKQVTENAPPAFIWHTAADGLVPVQNSLYLGTALAEKGISVEMHIYPYGHHGLSLCDETVSKPQDIYDAVKYCSEWVPHCIKWIKETM